MLRADLLQQLHLLPVSVRDSIADATACGFSASSKGQPSHAWVLHRQSLLVWKSEDGGAATVRRLSLPAPPEGTAFVEVVSQQQSSAMTVVMCTGGGLLYVWLDATFGGDPYMQQVATSDRDSTSVIRALAATPAAATASPGFLAVIATSDGSLHLYHGSQSGIFPRQFYQPGGSSASQGGMWQVLGAAVGTAKKVAVDYHLLEGTPHLRTSPSTAAALQLQLMQLDSSRWKLLVLTADALDCWLLGTLSGKQSTEQLLWSLDVYAAVLGRIRAVDHRVLSFAASAAAAQQQLPAQGGQDSSSSTAARPSKEVIYVWSASLAADSATMFQHTCSAFALEDGPNKGPRLLLSQAIPTAAAMPSPKQASHGWQLLAHAGEPSCLLLAPNGVLVEWLRTREGLPKVVSGSDSNLAIACSGYSSNWQVLNKVFGVLEFTARSSRHVEPQHPIDAAKALLERVVNMMQQEYTAGCPYRELATGLASCLSDLGMLDSPEGRAVLVATSSSIVDSLPRAGAAGVASLQAMLANKQARHSLYLTALQYGGVLQRLPSNVLATLFEHAQMLAAAARVLEYQCASEAAPSDQDAASQVLRDRLQRQASQRAIEAAGSLAAAGAGGPETAEQLPEVFFGRPTVSLPALFQAVSAHAADIRHAAAGTGQSAGVQELLEQLLGLCGLLVAAADAAERMRQGLKHTAYNEVTAAEAAGPGWLAGEGPRAAWAELAEACLLVLPLLSELSQQQQLAHLAHLPAVSHLLEALQATLNDAADPAADMALAYKELPWRHGQQLLHVAQEELPVLRSRGVLDVSADAMPGSDSDVLALLPGLRETLVWYLQALAQAHRCWQLLYAACELMQGINALLEDQLQQQMRMECAASGPPLPLDSFTRFVMERWHRQNRVVELLQLGREGFTLQLQTYLADCPHLLWMSQVKARQYAAATSSLSRAAAAATAGKARRLWALSKLSVKASGAAQGGSRQALATASARLRQLQLQEELLPGRPGAQPMLAEELAARALKAAAQAEPAAAGIDQGVGGLRGAGAAVAAVEVLAFEAGSNKTDSYRELWQGNWLAVLRCTPLQELAEERAAVAQAGWQSDAYEAAIRDCALFQAFLAARRALRVAAAVSANVNPQDELEKVAAALQSQVQDAHQAEVFGQVVQAAVAASEMPV